MKKCAQKQFLSSALMAGLILLPICAKAAEEGCENAADVKPFSTKDYSTLCKSAGNPRAICKETYKNIKKWAEDYVAKAEDVCRKIKSDSTNLEVDDGQKGNAESRKTYFSGAKAKTDTLIMMAADLLTSKIPPQTKKASKELLNLANAPRVTTASAVDPKLKPVSLEAKKIFLDVNDYETKFRTAKFDSSVSGVADPQAKDLGGALTESSNFIRALITDKNKQTNLATKFQNGVSQATQAGNGLNTPTPPPTTAAAEKGPLDMATLAALAGPAAGLAGMLMQKKPESGISEPTPNSTLPAQEAAKPSNPASSKLVKDSSGGKNGASPAPADAAANDNNPGFESGAGGAFGEPFESGDSGISSGNGLKAASGATMGVSSGGSSSSPGGASSGEEEGKGRGTASAPPASEDALQSFGSGAGGLNFGGGSSDSSSSASPAPEEPMKEMLTDMETAIDGDLGSLYGEGGEVQGEQGIAAQDSESLFPRVSACYVRNLKRGQLLNGLGESVADQ